MILLDTDIFTLYSFRHPNVYSRLMNAEEPAAITAITQIEVLRGRFASVLTAADGPELILAWDRLSESYEQLERMSIVPISRQAAAHFDRLKDDRKLRRIGRADLLNACIALAEAATFVTRNVKHYSAVPGLKLEDWST